MGDSLRCDGRGSGRAAARPEDTGTLQHPRGILHHPGIGKKFVKLARYSTIKMAIIEYISVFLWIIFDFNWEFMYNRICVILKVNSVKHSKLQYIITGTTVCASFHFISSGQRSSEDCYICIRLFLYVLGDWYRHYNIGKKLLLC